MSKNQFTGTATQPQRNRKLCQFNKDQYCMRAETVFHGTNVTTPQSLRRNIEVIGNKYSFMPTDPRARSKNVGFLRRNPFLTNDSIAVMNLWAS